MKESIRSHTYGNGLVLVAEPMLSLESAAFTFLVPAGCAFDPHDSLGLGTLTCEMTLRGSGSRDSRQFIQDLGNLGVEWGESVSVSHASYSGATLAKNLFPALRIFADLLQRPHFPDDQLEAARLVAIQELRAIEDEPSQKVMLELRRHQYPDPWGRSSYGESAAIESVGIEQIRRFFDRQFRANGTILGVAGQFDWQQLKDEVGRLFESWPSREVAEPGTGSSLAKREHLHHDSNQTQIGIGFDSLPYSHPDYFEAWGAVGILSGGMSARLFTEVREKAAAYATACTPQCTRCVIEAACCATPVRVPSGPRKHWT